jgi:hypothetical protein
MIFTTFFRLTSTLFGFSGKPAKSEYSPFLKATFPLINLTKRYHNERVSFTQLQNFCRRPAGCSSEKMRKEMQTLLHELGYQAVLSEVRNTDIFARRQGENILVRCLANGANFNYGVETGPSEEDIDLLETDRLASGASVAVLLSTSKIGRELRNRCKQYAIYGLCSFDLFKIITHYHLQGSSIYDNHRDDEATTAAEIGGAGDIHGLKKA